jgi:uncharacterized membrane protein
MPSSRPSGAPAWASPVNLVLNLIGVGLATYLTIAHFDTHLTLACASKGAINCEAVTHSAQSKVFGIPVAVLGLAFFVAMLPLHLPAAWRSADPRVRYGRLAYCASGILFVFYLVYAEAIVIKKICLWCTGVHVITLLIFVVTAFATATSLPGKHDDDSDVDLDDDEHVTNSEVEPDNRRGR